MNEVPAPSGGVATRCREVGQIFFGLKVYTFLSTPFKKHISSVFFILTRDLLLSSYLVYLFCFSCCVFEINRW